MKVFITGGTGNIGQYVTKAFLDAGHEVRLLVRNPDKIPAYKTMERVSIIQGDMHEFDKLKTCVEGCDVVVHIALGWGNNPRDMLEGDTKVTAVLLDYAEQAGVKNFIYTSSTAAAGDLFNGMDESAIRKPTDLYGSTKAATEMYVLGFRQYYSPKGGFGDKVKMHRNIIRPGYTFSNPMVENGASESDGRFKKIADAIVANENIDWNINDGTQFISSGQIAQFYLKLAESNLNEEIFFGLGNRFISWNELAKYAAEITPEYTGKITSPYEKGDPTCYSVEKMKKVFGLSFDGWDDLKDHIKWNLEEARKRAGK